MARVEAELAKTEIRYKLRSSVTIGSLRVLQKHGLNTIDGVPFSNAMLKVLADEKALREVIAAVFTDDLEQVPVENIESKKVSAGVRDFLLGLVNPS